MSLAPITLFVYNRLWHIQQTIGALQKNVLAKQSEIFIFSDGPRSEEDKKKVRDVRNYIHTIDGFKKIKIRERKKNHGLAESIIAGVTEIVNKYGKIIVLEDDLFVSKGFLKFMNESLMLFENNRRVGVVSGYVFPLNQYPKTPFFLIGGNCWGWGTWKRAWSLFEKDPSTILSYIGENNSSNEFDFNGYAGYIDSLKTMGKKTTKTWAILWYGTLFINHLLGYHPNYSLVQNIGFDGTGLHSGVTTIYRTKTVPFVKVVNIPLHDNEFARKELTVFFQKKLGARLPITQKIITKIRRNIKFYENSTS